MKTITFQGTPDEIETLREVIDRFQAQIPGGELDLPEEVCGVFISDFPTDYIHKEYPHLINETSSIIKLVFMHDRVQKSIYKTLKNVCSKYEYLNKFFT